jgi:predicted DNA-binding ArsR family transcriptional regulator
LENSTNKVTMDKLYVINELGYLVEVMRIYGFETQRQVIHQYITCWKVVCLRAEAVAALSLAELEKELSVKLREAIDKMDADAGK